MRASSAVILTLYQPGGIAPANLAALQHRGIDADPTLIVLDRRPQDARILGEVTLGERCHHAAQAGASDAQANGVPDGEHLADPGVFDEILFAVRGLENDVGR